jgi:hypothetical protein
VNLLSSGSKLCAVLEKDIEHYAIAPVPELFYITEKLNNAQNLLLFS